MVARSCQPERNAAKLMRQVRYFRQLAPEVLEELAQAAVLVHHQAGAIIFLEAEPSTGMYVVEAGIVRIIRLTRDGREHILTMPNPGDTFNDVAVLDGGPNPATAVAHSDVALWRIEREDLRRTAKQHPELAWALLEDLASRARYLVGLVEDLAMRSVRGRLARLLLEEAQASETDTVPRFLTQEEMAARLGTVREMVGRTLRSLAADGIIEFDRHRIVILDQERLAAEAEV